MKRWVCNKGVDTKALVSYDAVMETKPKTKYCHRCDKTLPIANFSTNKSSPDGLQNYCKPCRRLYAKERRSRAKMNSIPFECGLSNKKDFLDPAQSFVCSECLTLKHKNAFSDINWSRSGGYTCLKCERDNGYGERETGKTMDLILKIRMNTRESLSTPFPPFGCDAGFFKKYMEELFDPWMNWHNYGSTGWHIDHIFPLSKMHPSDKKRGRAHFWFNLQPMWGNCNIHKSNSTTYRQRQPKFHQYKHFYSLLDDVPEIALQHVKSFRKQALKENKRRLQDEWRQVHNEHGQNTSESETQSGSTIGSDRQTEGRDISGCDRGVPDEASVGD